MLLAHPLEGLLADRVIEVAIRLIFLLFLLLLLLHSPELALLVELLLLEVHDDLGGLHVLLRVDLVDLPEELALVQALLPVVDHIHGQLHLLRQHLAVVRLEEVVEQLVNGLEKGVLVDEAGEEDAEPRLEVVVAAAGVGDVDQGIGDPQLEGVVGVVLEEQDVDDVEEGLAEGEEEEDGRSDVVEVLRDDVGGAAVDEFGHRAPPAGGVGGREAAKGSIVLEQSEGRGRSGRDLVEIEAVAEDIGQISKIGIVSRVLVSIDVQDLVPVDAQHRLVHLAHHSARRLHEVRHLDHRSELEDVGSATAKHRVRVLRATHPELDVQLADVRAGRGPVYGCNGINRRLVKVNVASGIVDAGFELGRHAVGHLVNGEPASQDQPQRVPRGL